MNYLFHWRCNDCDWKTPEGEEGRGTGFPIALLFDEYIDGSFCPNGNNHRTWLEIEEVHP